MSNNLDIRDLYVDIQKDIYTSLYAKEGEVGSRGLRVFLLNNGSVMDTSDMELYLYAKTKKGEVYRQKASPVSGANGIFQLLYPANMLKAGELESELRLTKDNGSYVVASKTFTITVGKAIISEDMIDGSNDPDFLSILIDILDKIESGELKGEKGDKGDPGYTDVNKENIEAALGYTPANQEDVDELFTLVSNGKALIAAAITDMGVETSSSDTFQTMSDNIRAIQSGTVIGLDTSLISSTYEMFKDSPLTSLDLSFFDTSNVRNMGYMFNNASAEHLDLSSFDTSKVENMESMFYQAKAKTIDISSFDTSSVNNMTAMFSDMPNLLELDVSHFDTSNVMSMNSMFHKLDVGEIDLSNFNTENVEDFFAMFNSAKIDNLDLSSFNMYNAWEASQMFENFEGNNLTLPTDIYIGILMFTGAKINELDFTSYNIIRLPYYLGELFMGFEGDLVNISNWNVDDPDSYHYSTSSMFEGAKIDNLIMTGLGFYSIEDISYMFKNAEIPNLNLSDFAPDYVDESVGMFEGFKGDGLILPHFGGVEIFDDFFRNAVIDEILFECGYLMSGVSMFEGTQTQTIDMSTMDSHNVSSDNEDFINMFAGCTATVIYVGDEDLKNQFEDPLVNPDNIPIEVK